MRKLIFTLSFIIAAYAVNAQILYGTTVLGGSGAGGVICKQDIATNTLSAVMNFDVDGAYPQLSKLMQAVDGKLYGITSGGGSNGYGVIFSVDPSTSAYTKLKDFDYTNGSYPSGGLVQATDGKLYGMTNGGGSNGYGVIFSFDPSTSTYTKLKDFDNTNGSNPYGSLVQAADGKLYGMTHSGGSSGYGTIFSFAPSTSAYIKLKDFDNTNGSYPFGSLVQSTNGKLYGMTNGGGSNGYGVIFSFDPSTSTYTKLKDFDNTNGSNPYGSLVQAADGKLYGMTHSGGSSGYGTIFSFAPSTSAYIKLKDFDNTNGSYPFGSLVQSTNGKLYGMTNGGGSNGYGVIFSFDAATSDYTKLKDFSYTNGSNTDGSLTQASDGKLYGTTDVGGLTGNGVIFSYVVSSSDYTVVNNFGTTATGTYAYGGLVKSTDGKLYAMTSQGGSNGDGVIYSYNPSTSTFTKLKDFDNTNGSYPYGGLTQAKMANYME